MHSGFPSDFDGQFGLIFKPEWSDQLPVGIVLFVASLVIIIAFARPLVRNFSLIWIFFSGLIFLNPITANLIIENVTTPTAYWRLFYLLILPLLILMAIHETSQKFQIWSRFKLVLPIYGYH